MNELKVCRVQSDTSNLSLQRFLGGVLSVADDGMADRRELHSDLILQSGDERDSDERSSPQTLVDGILEFGASRCGIAFGG